MNYFQLLHIFQTTNATQDEGSLNSSSLKTF